MAHTGSRFGSEQVAGRRAEEVEHRRVVPVGRVRYIDDDLCALERLVEALPVYVSTPDSGDAASASCPAWRNLATSFHPIRPLPPMTTMCISSPFA